MIDHMFRYHLTLKTTYLFIENYVSFHWKQRIFSWETAYPFFENELNNCLYKALRVFEKEKKKYLKLVIKKETMVKYTKKAICSIQTLLSIIFYKCLFRGWLTPCTYNNMCDSLPFLIKINTMTKCKWKRNHSNVSYLRSVSFAKLIHTKHSLVLLENVIYNKERTMSINISWQIVEYEYV